MNTQPAAGHNGDVAVDIANVAKNYGAVVAVKQVSLPIRRGEFLTLLGPSGCGKTTLLNMIAGFEAPTAGTVSIDGRDVTNVPPHLRDTGMVFQNYALFPHMNVFDNVAFGLRMRKVEKQKIAHDVEAALDMVKLSGMGGRRVKQLSGGQQQRVALARAIVFGPSVLLLDEPLSALDKNLRTQMQFELKDLHRKTGLTTVFVTHDQGEALSMSDRIVVMSKGEIQQISKPLELYSRPVNSFVASFIGEINQLPVARLKRSGKAVAFAFQDGLALDAGNDGAALPEDDADVSIFVRPESIAIADASGRAGNVVNAKVVSHIYQGTHTVTRIEAAGLGLLDMRVGGGQIIDQKPAGSAIDVHVSLDNAVVLKAVPETK
ncbi:ABC transporter ATP-binding protein [Manganibacter manganicus]|uniref:Spermidine/putrescine import ATP-binding protein PotA n=1 Tax=Manganibacter manganicus TaxID=1873176 RepID=A0A1V8RLC5_9HYPH|nr:ABC transporter ATP-binding protein [Pseudaminobacter manganicus]OQM74010.1 Fe3+/spermidine/putrescine ABC transporter ATP-binding protein [Pseudaminobacter manganicus]